MRGSTFRPSSGVWVCKVSEVYTLDVVKDVKCHRKAEDINMQVQISVRGAGSPLRASRASTSNEASFNLSLFAWARTHTAQALVGRTPCTIENDDVQLRCYKIHYRQPKFYNRLGTQKHNRMCKAQSILKIDQKHWLCTFLFSVNTNCWAFSV